MQFVCQIALETELFGESSAQMAYLFIEPSPKSSSYDASSGDNAIILQPGTCSIPFKPVETGPSIYRRVKGPRKLLFRSTLEIPCEYEAHLDYSEEPDLTTLNRLLDEDEMKADSIIKAADRTKLGGTPIFVQDDELPLSDPWTLLIQLNSCDVPFHLPLGDCGVIYAFINKCGTEARMLWQCY